MTGKQGAAEWLRGIVEEYEADRSHSSCSKMAKLIVGIECKNITCRKCQALVMTAIADRIDAERALPKGVEWPRFEDGELVKVGDEVEWTGDVMRVDTVCFHRECWSLSVSCPGVDGTFHGEYGERVKRPTPKVLDADGAPINVGDTVYLRSNGRKGEVTGFYEEDGVTWVAVSYELGGNRMTVNTEGKALTHERPDSWERLEEDAYHLVMSEYLETPEKDVSDIVRRAKALAKAGEGE